MTHGAKQLREVGINVKTGKYLIESETAIETDFEVFNKDLSYAISKYNLNALQTEWVVNNAWEGLPDSFVSLFKVIERVESLTHILYSKYK